MYTNDGRSEYKAVVLSLNGNVRQSDLLTASVTFASKKNISDDFSPEFPFGYPNDPSRIDDEYGRSRAATQLGSHPSCPTGSRRETVGGGPLRRPPP